MAVLVEGLSVIARSNGISKHYEGGDKAFIAEVPTANFCFDGELTRIGFMHPEDVSLYTKLLSERGLDHISKTDFVVVDQLHYCAIRRQVPGFLSVLPKHSEKSKTQNISKTSET